MKKVTSVLFTIAVFCLSGQLVAQIAELKPLILNYEPFIWPSDVPDDCPFVQSKEFNEIKFLGVKSGYRYGDTWYPTWASNDTLYSPWTDGRTKHRLGKKGAPR